ncbi:MAG: hypothetical protein ACO3S4_03525 [Pseudohongiellaceae bacterium]
MATATPFFCLEFFADSDIGRQRATWLREHMLQQQNMNSDNRAFWLV